MGTAWVPYEMGTEGESDSESERNRYAMGTEGEWGRDGIGRGTGWGRKGDGETVGRGKGRVVELGGMKRACMHDGWECGREGDG